MDERERTIRQIDRLFNRQRRGWYGRDTVGHFPALLNLILANQVRVRLERIPCFVCAQAYEGINPQGRRSESPEHALMKRAARLWMHRQGARDAVEEAQSPVGRSDVYSAKADWIVEVGNTPIDKLDTALREPAEPVGPRSPRFTLIPFQDLFRRDGKTPRSLIAVDFSCDRDASAYLVAVRDAALPRAGDVLARANAR